MRTPSSARFFRDPSIKLIVQRKGLAVVLSAATALLSVAVSWNRFSTGVHAQEAIPPPAGTTFTVNTTADPGGPFATCTSFPSECTLRAAIEAANANPGDDTINFAIPASELNCRSGHCVINLAAPLPNLSTNIAINGPGIDNLTVRRASGGEYRIFTVTTSGVVTFSGLTIRDGREAGNSGGGIVNVNGGAVNVTNCALLFNFGRFGGAIGSTGPGPVNITDSTLSSNSAQIGGAVFTDSGTVNITGSTISNNSSIGGGGGIYGNTSDSTLNISGSIISGNSSSLSAGGGIFASGPLNLTGSLLSGNSAGNGGGLFTGTVLNISNSTLNGNTAIQEGGALYNFQAASARMDASTIVNNSAARSGGIFSAGTDPQQFKIKNSIVALNAGVTPDAAGTFTSFGFNLIGKRDGSTGFTAPADQTGTIAAPLDPKLNSAGPQDNGGPTPTIALLCGSPAIDKGTSSGLAGVLTTDQRGSGFPRTFDDPAVANGGGSDGTDIGAFERQQTCGAIVQFSSANYSVVEDCTTVTITVNRTGDTSSACSVDYATANGTATERRDYITALGRLQFAAGETSKSFAVLINEDSNVEVNETFNISLSNPSAASIGTPAVAAVQITDDASEPATNVIDDPQTYVCQHYHDFLNRQPDSSGFAFWTGQLTSCGSDAACLEVRRINVSASFFLSIEFQDTGYLVERIYKAAFGDATSTSTIPSVHQLAVPVVRLNEFLADTQAIGQGLIVGQGNWEQLLENNKQAFTAAFVQRSRFTTAFPTSLTAAQFVDRLNTNAGNPLSPTERNQLVNDLSTNAKTRAQVLRAVAEDPDLKNAEFNRAFVLLQYLGYLRRNPNDPQDTDYTGYDFWLTKLNQFGGNYINAEMVKAFLTSIEYRQRFGP